MSHWLRLKKNYYDTCISSPLPSCSAPGRCRVLPSSGSPAHCPAVLLLHPPCSHHSTPHPHSPTTPGGTEMSEPTEPLLRPKKCRRISSSEGRLRSKINSFFHSGHSSLTDSPASCIRVKTAPLLRAWGGLWYPRNS